MKHKLTFRSYRKMGTGGIVGVRDGDTGEYYDNDYPVVKSNVKKGGDISRATHPKSDRPSMQTGKPAKFASGGVVTSGDVAPMEEEKVRGAKKSLKFRAYR